MRILSFVFLFIFAVSVSAQSKTDDLYTQGMTQIHAGKFDDALASYKSALAVAEKKYAGSEYRARLHYNIGVCYFHLDRFELAEIEFKRALLLKPNYVPAFSALNRVRNRARDNDTAILVKEK